MAVLVGPDRQVHGLMRVGGEACAANVALDVVARDDDGVLGGAGGSEHNGVEVGPRVAAGELLEVFVALGARAELVVCGDDAGRAEAGHLLFERQHVFGRS